MGFFFSSERHLSSPIGVYFKSGGRESGTVVLGVAGFDFWCRIEAWFPVCSRLLSLDVSFSTSLSFASYVSCLSLDAPDCVTEQSTRVRSCVAKLASIGPCDLLLVDP